MAGRSDGGDLELAQDLDFERHTWTVERIGWLAMAAVGLAALAGWLGPGPLSGRPPGRRMGHYGSNTPASVASGRP